MPERAKITDVSALADLKAALAVFAEEVRTTLSGVDAEVGRVGQWLTHERPAYWKHEIRKREDKVQAAKAAIAAKQLARAPEPVSVAQERKDLQRAAANLEEGQKRAAAVKRWGPVWDREAQLYKSSCSGLTETLERDVPMGVARLERMMKALEAYLRVTGEETAEQLASGLDASTPDEADPALVKYANRRASDPSPEVRAGLTPTPVRDLRWAAGPIAEEDRVSLGRLAIAGTPPPPDAKIVVAWRTTEVASYLLSRAPASHEVGEDSGWYVGPLDRPEATGGLRATTVASLLAEWPWLAEALRLGPGSLVVVKAGRVAAVLDDADRDLWRTA
jgi:hypothetical protein